MNRTKPPAIACAILAAAALVAGCARGAPTATPAPATPAPTPAATVAPTPAPTPALTPGAVGSVAVATDVQFADSAPDLVEWSPPLLDVYAPPDAAELPLVVMFPPHGFTKDDSAALVQLANALAGQGAVAVLASWSQQDDPPAEFTDPALLEEIAGLGRSVAACAVSFAVAQTAEYGADPTRMVLVGELYGGNVASMVALGSPDPLPGCRASADWKAGGLVGLNADWLVTMPAWDALGPDAARAVAALSPWATIGEGPQIPVALVVSDAAVDMSKICADPDGDSMAWRDPTGAMRGRLDEVGAYDDGCLDLGDAARATAAEMTAAGLPAEVVQLSNPDGATRSGGGGQVDELGPADLALLAETIAKLARAPASGG